MQNKKNILFLAPEFFGYERIITLALKKIFKQVDYIDLRGNTLYLFRKLRLENKFVTERILKKLSKKSYDVIFIIKGENISEQLIKKISSFHNGEIYLYNWDSVKNYDNTHLFKYCTKVFSFDPVDCENLKVVYKELFVSKPMCLENRYFKDKLMFIGTARNDRIRILCKIWTQNRSNIECIFHLYFQGWFIYLIRIFMTPSLIFMPKKFIKFKKISYSKYLQSLRNVSYVVDIESENQSGLTIRSIEALCNGKILLTTNAFALKSPLNTGENIFLITRADKDPLSKIALSKKPKLEIVPELVKKYHVDMWLKEFFT